MLGPVILAASRSGRMRRLISAAPVTRQVVDRFIPGEDVDDIVPVVRDLAEQGLELTMDVVGEDITNPAQAAAEIGTTVTLDAEDHTTLDSMFAIHEELRKDFPQTGCVIQAYLFRTEADARRLAASGSRVRLVKGAYKEPASVAYQDKHEIDRAYVRVLRTLMEGEGYPMIGSHDPRLIAIGQELAHQAGRKLDEYEFQMLYGIRTDEHLRLAAEGHRMRVYTAYGTDWYGYFMRRLAEKPANLRFFARSMLTKG